MIRFTLSVYEIYIKFYKTKQKTNNFVIFTLEIFRKLVYNNLIQRLELKSLIDIVLVEPEIPANTGNIARTCAATGARLHLIEPLGFDISEKAIRRAGLDYWSLVEVSVYKNLDEFFEKHGDDNIWLSTTKAPYSYIEADFSQNVKLFFGKETKGLPEELRLKYANRCVRLPMKPEARSLNLSNSVAIMCYEALRQQGFPELMQYGNMKGDL